MSSYIREMTADEKQASVTRNSVNHNDMVNSPFHYNGSAIECIDAMTAMVDGVDNITSHQAYCWQNAFKYLWRFPYKNGVEDLKKCRWYLDRLIKDMDT